MIDLNTLQPGFRQKVDALLMNCRLLGLDVRPVYAIRTPLAQAKLWRQSRTTAVIRAKIADLRKAGADYLADTLDRAGPQTGPWATNAIPGYGWHNWGLACDCLIYEAGLPINRGDDPKYEQYCTEAEKLDLTCGYRWKNQDSGHVQFSEKEVNDLYNLKQVDDSMKLKFG